MINMTKKNRLQVFMESGDSINVATTVCLVRGIVESIDGEEVIIVGAGVSTGKMDKVDCHYIQIDDIKVITRQECRKKKREREKVEIYE